MMRLLRRAMCAVGLHSWHPDNDDFGHFLRCAHCEQRTLFYAWTAGTRRSLHGEVREMTPQEAKAFDAAFAHMGEAFREMDAAFDVLRDSGGDPKGEKP